MESIKLIQDSSNWLNSYYELAIEVSRSKDINMVYDLIYYIWQLDCIKGPFDKKGKKLNIWKTEDLTQLYGLTKINETYFPLVTDFLQEQNRSNWVNFSFSNSYISKFTDKDNILSLIYDFLEKLLYMIAQIITFRLAIIGENCSRIIYFDELKKSIKGTIEKSLKLYIQKRSKRYIHTSNIELIKLL